MARTVPLHLRIEPEIEAMAKQQARAEEIPLATFLARIVRRAVLVASRAPAPPNTPASTTEPTDQQIHAADTIRNIIQRNRT